MTPAPAPALVATLATDSPAHDAAVEALYARAFGPGRHAKVSARVREGLTCLYRLSRLALEGGEVAGACRLWPAQAGGAATLFLGPLAVDAGRRRDGLGAALTDAACAAGAAAGWPAVVLVGDLAYFARCGFSRVPAGRLVLPGPVDPARVLWRALAPGGTDALAGPLAGVRQDGGPTAPPAATPPSARPG